MGNLLEIQGQVMAIRKVSAEEAKKIKGRTNWEKVDKLTDEEIEEAARSDPDSALPSEEELRDFRPALPSEEELRDFRPAKSHKKGKPADGKAKNQKR
jgi:hypothetical protein